MSDYDSDSLLEDLDALRVEGHAHLRGGSVRASRRALASSESLGNAQYSPSSVAADDMDDFPVRLISMEALQFVGFRVEAAESIWHDWIQCPDEAKGGLYDLMWFGKQHIRETRRNAFDRAEDWASVLGAYGLKDEFITAVLNPDFEEIRLTQSCQFWAFDTIDLRFRSLGQLKRKSQYRLQQRKSKQSKMEQPLAESSSSPKKTSSTDSSFPVPLTALTSTHPAEMLGHTLLWKGLDVERVKDLLNSDGTTNDLGCMVSLPRGDFNSRTLGYYFTKEKDVAEQYAAFAKARSSSGNSITVCLVAVIVSHDFIKSIPEDRKKELWYGESDKTWSEYVWHCRLGHIIPSHLRHISAADLIEGSVAGCGQRQIEKLNSYQDISNNHLLSRGRQSGTPRGNATQWFFSNNQDFEDRLMEATNKNVFLCTAAAEK
ncbi:hypothetical protein FH972_026231 [Carpinus fangiana]|uniref:Uncharacterized protein n=1 Tax=Carpinus fangiana TaxID=176857 RepID=A0A5N6L3W5_9ROSI|nr:hypothetical protein FH972_026231 [Carpinus fangiana]